MPKTPAAQKAANTTDQTPDGTQIPEGAATPEKAADWAQIETDYRAGVKTLRQIGEENGISHTLVARKAKQFGWSRDLSAKIKAKADELVSREAVSKVVTVETRMAERQVVDANARAIADIRLAHRKDIARARNLTIALLSELEQSTDPQTLAKLRDLGEIMASPDDNGRDKLNELYQAVISLPERSKTMKVLAESLQKMVDMERTAFGMDNTPDQTPNPMQSFLAAMKSSAIPVVRTGDDE